MCVECPRISRLLYASLSAVNWLTNHYGPCPTTQCSPLASGCTCPGAEPGGGVGPDHRAERGRRAGHGGRVPRLPAAGPGAGAEVRRLALFGLWWSLSSWVVRLSQLTSLFLVPSQTSPCRNKNITLRLVWDHMPLTGGLFMRSGTPSHTVLPDQYT